MNSKSKSAENSDTKTSKNSNFKVLNYRFQFRFTPLTVGTLLTFLSSAVVGSPFHWYFHSFQAHWAEALYVSMDHTDVGQEARYNNWVIVGSCWLVIHPADLMSFSPVCNKELRPSLYKVKSCMG